MSAHRRTYTALIGLLLTAAALIATTPMAFAQVPPDDHSGSVLLPPPRYTVSYGSPIWVFVVVGFASIALTVTAMLITRRLRQTHQLRAAQA